jgi:hypothetical protein
MICRKGKKPSALFLLEEMGVRPIFASAEARTWVGADVSARPNHPGTPQFTTLLYIDVLFYH